MIKTRLVPGSFTAQPFRKKLTLITLAVTAIALLMSCLGLIAVQYSGERQKLDEINRQLGDVLASNLGAAVVFGDTATADTITHSAQTVPNILLIDVRNSGGDRVSVYFDPSLTESEFEQAMADVTNRQARMFNSVGSYSRPIMVNDEEVGTLVIGYEYTSATSIVAGILPVAAILFIGCLIIAIFVSNLLKKMVFRPLDRLTDSMQAVRMSGKLEERVEPSDDPDFDKIISSYNTMLGEIEMRTSELSVAMDQLEVARDQAQEANVAKSAFLANMSHELRTPLNAIIGYTEVLQDDLTKAGLDRSVEDIGWIYSSSKQLLELINSLLDLSKIEAGKMDLDIHTFDLRKLLREVEALLQPLAVKHSNELTISIDDAITTVSSDSTKLRQCLLNLGSNACKFTENGFVQISARQEGQELVLEVSDTGIGMSEDDIARLFQPFMQSDTSTTRRFGGTGLGLALVKSFTEMLGGTVDVNSEPGFGTTFTIRLAQAGASKAREDVGNAIVPVDTVARRSKSGKPLALILEDEPSAVELLKRLLDRNGYSCVVAGDGKAGLDMAREQSPDLVLLDIGLPVLDGWNVLESFSQDASLRAIPTIVVSVDDRKKMSFELGASDHLVKPINTDDLESILKFYSDKRSEKVLLVEDDAATARLYENGLRQCGFDVAHAENGDVAREKLHNEDFALVVTDLMMPSSDGYQLIESIGEMPIEVRPPVVVITGATLAAESRSQLQDKVKAIHLKSGLTPRHLASEISEVLDA